MLELKETALTPYDLFRDDALIGITKSNTSPYKQMVLAAVKKIDSDNAGKNRSHNTLIRASEIRQPAVDAHFLREFGQSDRTVADDSSREGGIPQALMLMNGVALEYIMKPKAYALKAASDKGSKNEQIASLYISILSRLPSANEVASINASDKQISSSTLAWILFNTREFIFVP